LVVININLLSFTNNVLFCTFITYCRWLYFTHGYAGMGSMSLWARKTENRTEVTENRTEVTELIGFGSQFSSRILGTEITRVISVPGLEYPK
jgi:hypothetical protein